MTTTKRYNKSPAITVQMKSSVCPPHNSLIYLTTTALPKPFKISNIFGGINKQRNKQTKPSSVSFNN